MQRRPARRVRRLHTGHGVARVGHRLLRRRQRRVVVARDVQIRRVVVQHDGRRHAVQRVQRVVDPSHTVHAHHAFDVQFRFHCLRSFLRCPVVCLVFCRLDMGVRLRRRFFLRLRARQRAEAAQPERVGDDAHAGHAHRRRREHGRQAPAERREKDARRQRNADGIVKECPEQILLDVAQHGARQANRIRHVPQVAAHQDDARAVNRDVRTRADGDAHIRTRQCGRVVDAVAHHGDPLAGGLQRRDVRLLVLRQHLCLHGVDAQLALDGGRRHAVVARQHAHLQPEAAQHLNRLRARRLDRVHRRQHAQQAALLREIQRRLAAARQRVHLLRHAGQIDVVLLHQRGVARQIPVRAQRRGDAAPEDRFKFPHLLRRDALLLCIAHDRLGERVLAVRLDRGRDAHQLLLRNKAGEQHIGHARAALSDRAGLVEHDRVDVVQLLQRLRRAEQDAVFRALARADHDGDRRGQSERAGTADHQHRNADGQRKLRRRAAQQPDDRRRQRNEHDNRDKHARDAVRQPRNRRLGRRRLFDQPDDLRQRGVRADALRANLQKALAVDRRRDHLAAGRLFHRDGFARDRRFVHTRTALFHDAVHRHAVARPQHDQIARMQLRDGDLDLPAVALDQRRLRRELHERFNRGAGLAARAHFKVFAHRDERQNRARGLKIQIHMVLRDQLHVARAQAGAHAVNRKHAVHQRGGRADRDERVHVGRAVPQRLEPVDKKRAVQIDDGQAQQKLGQRVGDGVFHPQKHPRQRQPHHMPHREIHQRDEKRDRPDQPRLHVLLLLFQRVFRLRGGRLRAFLRRAVARLRHRRAA